MCSVMVVEHAHRRDAPMCTYYSTTSVDADARKRYDRGSSGGGGGGALYAKDMFMWKIKSRGRVCSESNCFYGQVTARCN